MDYYNEIKNELLNNEILIKVKDYSKNRNDSNTYYNVGKLLNEAYLRYGEDILSKISKKLVKEFGRDFSKDKLKYMQEYYKKSKKDFNEKKDIISNFLKKIKSKSLSKNIYVKKAIKELILENIELFLEELGKGFSFVEKDYLITINDKNNYIDILLYNVNFSCYAVVEVKCTELKKGYMNKIHNFMNYIDVNLKKEVKMILLELLFIKKIINSS